ncbi:MAG: gamma-glutamyl-gamma-aminobutyrate hydrolase family protein [Lactobacillaceae bacterium]|jgi:putative glutamine amidotransferase|nr:gamma-glutamyl-gamma-aminobutyrate hydrolase family protein [Lactobacillaceae bacterium]
MEKEKIMFLNKKRFDNHNYDSYVIEKKLVDKETEAGSVPYIKLKDEDIKILSSVKQGGKDSPLIGIMLAEEGEYYALTEYYIKSVLQNEADIRFISFDKVVEQTAGVNGVLVPGGAYNSPSEWYIKGTFSNLGKRSLANLKITETALAKKLPILGICAGMQMISGIVGYNHGVRLYLSLVKETGTKEVHQGLVNHPININKNSMLYKYIYEEKAVVNSNHKEAVVFETIGDDSSLLVSAVSPDGIVEAVEVKNYPAFLLGVQWHPERLAVNEDDIINKKIFSAFVAAAKNKKAPS